MISKPKAQKLLIFGIISIFAASIIISKKNNISIKINNNNNTIANKSNDYNFYANYKTEIENIYSQINVLKKAIIDNNLALTNYRKIFNYNIHYSYGQKKSIKDKVNILNLSITHELDILYNIRNIINNHPYNYLEIVKNYNYSLPSLYLHNINKITNSLNNIETYSKNINKMNTNINSISYQSEEIFIGIKSVKSIVSDSKSLIFSKINFKYKDFYYFSNYSNTLKYSNYFNNKHNFKNNNNNLIEKNHYINKLKINYTKNSIYTRNYLTQIIKNKNSIIKKSYIIAIPSFFGVGILVVIFGIDRMLRITKILEKNKDKIPRNPNHTQAFHLIELKELNSEMKERKKQEIFRPYSEDFVPKVLNYPKPLPENFNHVEWLKTYSHDHGYDYDNVSKMPGNVPTVSSSKQLLSHLSASGDLTIQDSQETKTISRFGCLANIEPRSNYEGFHYDQSSSGVGYSSAIVEKQDEIKKLETVQVAAKTLKTKKITPFTKLSGKNPHFVVLGNNTHGMIFESYHEVAMIESFLTSKWEFKSSFFKRLLTAKPKDVVLTGKSLDTQLLSYLYKKKLSSLEPKSEHTVNNIFLMLAREIKEIKESGIQNIHMLNAYHALAEITIFTGGRKYYKTTPKTLNGWFQRPSLTLKNKIRASTITLEQKTFIDNQLQQLQCIENLLPVSYDGSKFYKNLVDDLNNTTKDLDIPSSISAVDKFTINEILEDLKELINEFKDCLNSPREQILESAGSEIHRRVPFIDCVNQIKIAPILKDNIYDISQTHIKETTLLAEISELVTK